MNDATPAADRRLVIRNTLYMSGAQLASLLVSLVALPIFLKNYGTSIYGLFLLVSSVASMVTLFDLGTTSIITKETAHYLALDDRDGLRRTVSSAFIFYVILALVTAAALVFIGWNTQVFFRVNETQAQLLRLMFFVQAGVQGLTFISWPARPILAGFQRYGILALSTVLGVIGSTLAIVFVLVTGRGPLVLVALSGLSSVGVAGVLLVATGRILPRRSLRLRGLTLGPEIRHLLKLGLPLFVVQITGFLIKQQSDKIVLGVFLSAAAVALYEIPSKLMSLATQAVDTSVGSLLPYLSGLTARGEHDRVRNVYVYGSRYLGLLLCPLLGLLFIAAPTFVHLWCGPQFAIAGVAARILLAAPILWPFIAIGDSLLISMNKMSKWTPWALLAGVIGLGAALLLVRPFGLIGVAAASAIAAVSELLFFVPLLFRVTGARVSAWLRSAVIPGLVSILVSWALFLLAQRMFDLSSMGRLAAVCAGVIGIVWLMVWLLIMSTAERNMISDWINPAGLARKVLPRSLYAHVRKRVLRSRDRQPVSSDAALVRWVRRYLLRRKPRLERLDIHLTDHCNLNCAHCSYFSNISPPVFADLEGFTHDLTASSTLFAAIRKVYLLGGEPLLHPQAAEFIYRARRILGPASEIYLVTNGLLLAKQPEALWDALHETDTTCRVTPYPVKLDWETIEAQARRFEVHLDLTPAVEEFFVIPLDLDVRQFAKDSYKACAKHDWVCPNVREGKLYPCGVIGYADVFAQRYGKPDFKPGDTDAFTLSEASDPATAFKRGWQAMDFLLSAPPFCSHCDWTRFPLAPWKHSKGTLEEWL